MTELEEDLGGKELQLKVLPRLTEYNAMLQSKVEGVCSATIRVQLMGEKVLMFMDALRTLHDAMNVSAIKVTTLKKRKQVLDAKLH